MLNHPNSQSRCVKLANVGPEELLLIALPTTELEGGVVYWCIFGLVSEEINFNRGIVIYSPRSSTAIKPSIEVSLKPWSCMESPAVESPWYSIQMMDGSSFLQLLHSSFRPDGTGSSQFSFRI